MNLGSKSTQLTQNVEVNFIVSKNNLFTYFCSKETENSNQINFRLQEIVFIISHETNEF